MSTHISTGSTKGAGNFAQKSAVRFKVQKYGAFRINMRFARLFLLRPVSPNCTKTGREVLWFCEAELAEFHLRNRQNGVIINIGSVWVACADAHLIRLRNIF